jgi:tRNA(fMet)-specific endonuclease VapC
LLHTANLEVLARRNGWSDSRRIALANALDQLVTVNVEGRSLIDAYVRIESACRTAKLGDHTMGHNDMWIAATALVSGQPLITTDKDFNHLHGRVITVHWVDPTLGKTVHP